MSQPTAACCYSCFATVALSKGLQYARTTNVPAVKQTSYPPYAKFQQTYTGRTPSSKQSFVCAFLTRFDPPSNLRTSSSSFKFRFTPSWTFDSTLSCVHLLFSHPTHSIRFQGVGCEGSFWRALETRLEGRNPRDRAAIARGQKKKQRSRWHHGRTERRQSLGDAL